MSYKVKVPDDIVDLIRGLHPILKKRIRAAFTVICNDPYCGKALKEELTGLRSYRIRRFRIIYKVSSRDTISIVAIGPRKYIYEETYRIISCATKL